MNRVVGLWHHQYISNIQSQMKSSIDTMVRYVTYNVHEYLTENYNQICPLTLPIMAEKTIQNRKYYIIHKLIYVKFAFELEF